MLCGNKVDEQCGQDSSMTWQMKSEAERIRLVRGKDKGKPAWHYVLLVDDEETIEKLEEALGGNLNVADYGQLLYSGQGKDPPNEVVEEVHKKYKIDRGVSTMASVKCLVAVDAFRNKHSAGGTRTVFILGSLASLPSADVVFRRSITLSDEDKNTLSKGLALPPDRWTDLDVILTKYAQDENVSIGPQELFTQENEVSCETVLAKLRDFFSSSTDKDGAVIHYFGNGRKFRGDWCFSDGYITFQDLMDVYMETYRGRVLTIVSDCSHSGSWVKQCYEFFEGQGIIPCGHHAVKKGILLKVFTSCRQNDTASVLRFSMQCIFVNKNTGGNINYNIPKKIGKMQQSSGKDFTTMLCGKKVNEECVRDSSIYDMGNGKRESQNLPSKGY
ncbi:hypothetical protein GBAR_LOCUS19859 [Geodia barretti]|uniref:Uncharacterized protein n=1 Tax=Geodia barretti TaxID=519541 RepID=A0AA35SUU4_GEOBA|nr:hypothetical protein GBAR_LOCUS19859 [Geodia barretti]